MSVSSSWFKIKRFLEEIGDFFRNLFREIGNFFHFIFSNEKTYLATKKIRQAKDKIFFNLKQNRENLRRRNLDNHGFEIGDNDI